MITHQVRVCIRSYSRANRMFTGYDQLTNRCFNALGLLNIHKELTDNLDLAELGN